MFLDELESSLTAYSIHVRYLSAYSTLCYRRGDLGGFRDEECKRLKERLQ